jgi:hypothetical protein
LEASLAQSLKDPISTIKAGNITNRAGSLNRKSTVQASLGKHQTLLEQELMLSNYDNDIMACFLNSSYLLQIKSIHR